MAPRESFFRETLCADCANPRPRVSKLSVASVVAVPAPLDLKERVVVGLAPRGQNLSERLCQQMVDSQFRQWQSIFL